MKLYNTLTREKENFKSIKPKQVGLYSCGPTVYNYAHIGNLRSYIFSDILRRALEYNDFNVKQIVNITDVGHLTSNEDEGEDKLEREARQQQRSAWEIAKFYEQEFRKDIGLLNIKTPYKMPRATENIKEQIALIKKLEQKGVTYKISDGVYFDTSRIKNYGKLAGQKLLEKRGGARIKLSKEKRNKTDFALWKFRLADKKREMEWVSPWGKGFPGWHIECSAMSVKYLGQPFDIHTGGQDHIPIHHSNEIAQSEAAFGKPLARYWLHNEFVVFDKEKLSKSKRNFITLRELEAKGYSALSYRYLCLQTHYRKQLNFSFKALSAAQNALSKFYAQARVTSVPKIGCAELEKNFLQAINDDLNTPECLAIVWETIKSKYPPSAKAATLLKFDKILGLDFKKYLGKKESVPTQVKKLAQQRDVARKEKNWAMADELRKKIAEFGYVIEDTEKGFRINLK